MAQNKFSPVNLLSPFKNLISSKKPLISPKPTASPTAFGLLGPKRPTQSSSFGSSLILPSTGLSNNPAISILKKAPPFSPQPTPQVKSAETGPSIGQIAPPPQGIQSQINAIRQQALDIRSQADKLSPKIGADKPTRPAVPQSVTDAQEAVESAEIALGDISKITPEELSTQGDLDRLIDAFSKGFTGIQDKTIPLEFITGQLASLENRALNLAEPLESKLSRLQAQRISAIEGSKFALDRADKKLETERALASGQDIETDIFVNEDGDTILFNAQTGEEIRNLGRAQEDEETQVISAGGRQLLVDTQTGEVIADLGSSEGALNRILAREELASEKDDATSSNIARAASTVVRDANTALDLIDTSSSFSGDKTSIFAANKRAALSKVKGSDEFEVAQAIQSVKDNIGIDALLNIKREGSGLGQVPQRQLETLQGLLGRLDVARNPALLRRDLSDALGIYEDILAAEGGSILVSDIAGSSTGRQIVTDDGTFIDNGDGTITRIN